MRTLASGTRLFIPSLVMVLAWRMFVAGGQVHFGQQAVTTVGPIWSRSSCSRSSRASTRRSAASRPSSGPT
jgi:hypothetical protein